MFGGTEDNVIDWVIDLTALTDAGIDITRPLRVMCGSSNSGQLVDADCPRTNVSCGTLAFSHPITLADHGVGVCGDGILGGREACDDTNLADGDGCSSACLGELGASCSTGADCASEHCDATICACADDNDCATGMRCATVKDPNTCVAPGCGNTIVEADEACDDGNTDAGDGCTAACLREANESCDLAAQCASGMCVGGQCIDPGCGNQVVEANELCDDGNAVDGDGCSSDCQIEAEGGCGCGTTDSRLALLGWLGVLALFVRMTRTRAER